MQASSQPAVTRRLPSGLHATPYTACSDPKRSCPVRVRIFSAVLASQMMQVPSLLAVAMRAPSGCQATPFTW